MEVRSSGQPHHRRDASITARRIENERIAFLLGKHGDADQHKLRQAESYPRPDPSIGAGLSGAPPTETGPDGLGICEGFLCDGLTAGARAVGCEMVEVVTGVAAFCMASTRAASEESWSNILFSSARWAMELCVSDSKTAAFSCSAAAFCCCDDRLSLSVALTVGSGIGTEAVSSRNCSAKRPKFDTAKAVAEQLAANADKHKTIPGTGLEARRSAIG
jgi:hypothetical protein